MKTIKRSIALVLAMILTLAMSVLYLQHQTTDQNTFSLTLNKAVKGHTYEAYQILSGDLSADKATLSNIKVGRGALQKQDRLLSAVMLLVMLKNSVVLVTTLQSLKSRRRLLVQT